jgi:hypothetical protein
VGSGRNHFQHQLVALAATPSRPDQSSVRSALRAGAAGAKMQL